MGLQSITRHDGINNSRFTQLFFLFEKQIFAFNVPFNSISTDAEIELLDDVIPNALYFTPQTQNFKETAKRDRHGKYYEQSLTLDIPKGRLVIDNTLENIGNNKLFLTYYDRNGQVRVLRNMQLLDSYELGSSNSYRFEFTGVSRTKAVYHTDNTLFDEFVNISDLCNCDSAEQPTITIVKLKQQHFYLGSQFFIGNVELYRVYLNGAIWYDYTFANGMVTFPYTLNNDVVTIDYYE